MSALRRLPGLEKGIQMIGKNGRNMGLVRLFLAAILLLLGVQLTASYGLLLADEPAVRYVDALTGDDTGTCLEPLAPCQTIQYAVGESADGDTVAVAGGVYSENLLLDDGRSRTIRGGYAYNGVGWLPDEDVTILNGSHAGSTVEIRDHSDTRIESLRVIGGMGQDDPTFGNGCGGFKIQNSNVEIVAVGVRQNSAGTGDGGGICAAGDDGKITLLLDKVFVGGNTAVNVGGGMVLHNTQTMIINSVFTNNRTESGVANVMVLNHEDEVMIINSTIADNNPTGDQAILVHDGTITMKNSIMWGNALNLQADPPCPDCFVVTYSDIEQETAGIGNISKNPRFVNAEERIFRLRKNSPCINAGDAAGAPPDDLRGNPRDQWPDMGAFEYLPPNVYLPVIQS